MGYNAPAGADYDSRAPWLSFRGEPEEKEWEPEDEDDISDEYHDQIFPEVDFDELSITTKL